MEIKKLLKVGTCLKIPVLFTSERFYSTIHGVSFFGNDQHSQRIFQSCVYLLIARLIRDCKRKDAAVDGRNASSS